MTDLSSLPPRLRLPSSPPPPTRSPSTQPVHPTPQRTVSPIGGDASGSSPGARGSSQALASTPHSAAYTEPANNGRPLVAFDFVAGHSIEVPVIAQDHTALSEVVNLKSHQLVSPYVMDKDLHLVVTKDIKGDPLPPGHERIISVGTLIAIHPKETLDLGKEKLWFGVVGEILLNCDEFGRPVEEGMYALIRIHYLITSSWWKEVVKAGRTGMISRDDGKKLIEITDTCSEGMGGPDFMSTEACWEYATGVCTAVTKDEADAYLDINVDHYFDVFNGTYALRRYGTSPRVKDMSALPIPELDSDEEAPAPKPKRVRKRSAKGKRKACADDDTDGSQRPTKKGKQLT